MKKHRSKTPGQLFEVHGTRIFVQSVFGSMIYYLTDTAFNRFTGCRVFLFMEFHSLTGDPSMRTGDKHGSAA